MIFVLGAVTVHSLIATPIAVEKEIRALEEKKNDAYARNDLPA